MYVVTKYLILSLVMVVVNMITYYNTFPSHIVIVVKHYADAFPSQGKVMATAESQAFRRQFSILINAIDDPLSIAVEAYSRCLVSKDVRDKMLISSMTAKEKAVVLLTSVESSISTNQQSFHEFVRVLKTQTNLVQTAENLQMEYCKCYFMQFFFVFLSRFIRSRYYNESGQLCRFEKFLNNIMVHKCICNLSLIIRIYVL